MPPHPEPLIPATMATALENVRWLLGEGRDDLTGASSHAAMLAGLRAAHELVRAQNRVRFDPLQRRQG